MRIFVAGHRGMVGSALVRALRGRADVDLLVRSRDELDLRNADAVDAFFAAERPDAVFLAAARVGGILANDTFPWDFAYENLAIELAVLGAAQRHAVERLVFFGSSCIYPKLAPQPLREDALLTGPLEPTNEAYAIAKIAGVELVAAAGRQYGRRWLSLMPTNLYGPGDNYDLNSSHVVPAMLRKFHDAVAGSRGAPVVLWGTGAPRREFLHVDDLASAALHLFDRGATGLYNVGYGSDIRIRDLAQLVADIAGYGGEIVWDASKPDGTPRKLLDSSKLRATGWAPTISLDEGLPRTYARFVEEHAAQ